MIVYSRFRKTGRRVGRIILRSDGATFSSLKEASEASGVGMPGISLALNGKQRTAGGYGWKFRDESADGERPFQIRGDRRYRIVVRSDGRTYRSAKEAIGEASVPASTFYRHMRAGKEISGYSYVQVND